MINVFFLYRKNRNNFAISRRYAKVEYSHCSDVATKMASDQPSYTVEITPSFRRRISFCDVVATCFTEKSICLAYIYFSYCQYALARCQCKSVWGHSCGSTRHCHCLGSPCLCCTLEGPCIFANVKTCYVLFCHSIMISLIYML